MLPVSAAILCSVHLFSSDLDCKLAMTPVHMQAMEQALAACTDLRDTASEMEDGSSTPCTLSAAVQAASQAATGQVRAVGLWVHGLGARISVGRQISGKASKCRVMGAVQA